VAGVFANDNKKAQSGECMLSLQVTHAAQQRPEKAFSPHICRLLSVRAACCAVVTAVATAASNRYNQEPRPVVPHAVTRRGINRHTDAGRFDAARSVGVL